MTERRGGYAEKLREALLGTAGDAPAELRRAVRDRGAGVPAPVPAELERFVEKIAKHAYRVTDEDVQALRAGGYSEDATFEIVLSAAFGAAEVRLECGLAALRREMR